MDDIKRDFEGKFPGMSLNLTIDLSKYLDVRLDEQLASDNVYVDSIILQTVHNFPRWAQDNALLNYAPLGVDQVYPAFKDSESSSWYGLEILYWKNIWSTEKLPGADFDTFQEFLKPGYKNRLVLAYPNDEDAVLFAFDLIMQRHGRAWFDALLKQNPRWIRGVTRTSTIIRECNSSAAASFTSTAGFRPSPGLGSAFPKDDLFVSWAQTGAILKKAPHPEGAKLLHAYLLSREVQESMGWSVRADVPPPAGLPDIMHMPTTNPTAFARWMSDRQTVERLRLWFESKLGTPQGESPLVSGKGYD
ncbi:hypothetical protein CDD83_3690 [Cordyceps sp. RAO-2017]|nr:hypothetical protein CDD83_3690 [Cordyceps sp. RAO-2017]